jgi:serine/threonine protein kinase
MRCAVCNTDNPDAAVACRSCGSALAVEDPAASEQVLTTGTVLQGGAFVVEGVLGQGGFGITYKGRDARLNRTVALKEFFPQAQGCLRRGTTVQPGGGITIGEFHEERNKFLEEGQRLAQFQHSSIVKVFSLFEENNTAYMVMEFLKGKTLLKMVEETGPLEERLLLQLIEQVAGGLGVVHQANVIHRDIKPENIMVAPDNRAVLIDFGTAREFAAGKTRKMTTMLTPGYAPLEQYGQHARFGVFTDMYALGATTYHLLTGQVPIQATDRAAGVELAAPRRLKSNISRQVSDAVMWAMEMKVDKRPQTASDFIQAMQGARSASSNKSNKGSTASPHTAPNPYQARIDQLFGELECIAAATPALQTGSAGSVAQSTYDSRINGIKDKLELIRSTLKVRLEDCPCCLQSTLKRVEVERSPRCPVCSGAQMRMRKLDQKLCPVCREGHIAPTKLESPIMFCPVCRSRSLRKEKRKRFGLPIDVWWVCPGCSAEFDVEMGGRAKLVSAGTDPLGVGKEYVGETLAVSGWQQLAPQSWAYWTCDRCTARFCELGDSRLSLDRIEHDPYGVGEKLLGKTYYGTVWIKIANGLSAKVGNTHCPACEANFDYDQVDKTLKLLDCDRGRFPRPVHLLGQGQSLESWSLFAAGKNSLSPGWLCSSCRAEFDEEGPEMKLVGAPPKYGSSVGQSRSFGNWHRLERILPSEEEEADLRRDLTELEAMKQDEAFRLLKTGLDRRIAIERQRQERKAGIEKQIQELVKRSFIGGFIPLGLQTTSILLKKDERVVWETAAFRLKQPTSKGVLFWESDGVGMLVVTDQRVIFRVDTGAMWSTPMTKLLSANHEYFRDQGMCVLWIYGRQKPVAFGGVQATATVSIAGVTYPIELTSHDLREVIQSRCGG